MQPIFETENISFVRVSENLVPDYLAMVNDIEKVGRFIGKSRPPITAEQETKWVQKKLAKGAPLFSMLDRETGAFIGNIEFMDVTDGAGELGIAITASMQDKGYGTEAITAMVRYGMDQMGLTRIFLSVFPDNARAIRVYEKCGFREYDRTAEDVFMEVTKDGLKIVPYTAAAIQDVIAFERHLREEEDVWGWVIDDAYIAQVQKSFEGDIFRDALSFLAYLDGQARVPDPQPLRRVHQGLSRLDLRHQELSPPGRRPSSTRKASAGAEGPGRGHPHRFDSQQRGGPAVLQTRARFHPAGHGHLDRRVNEVSHAARHHDLCRPGRPPAHGRLRREQSGEHGLFLPRHGGQSLGGRDSCGFCGKSSLPVPVLRITCWRRRGSGSRPCA